MTATDVHVTAATPTAREPRPEPALGLRTLLSDSRVYAGRNIAHIRQIPEKLLDVTIQPLMFVLLFAYVFGGAIAVQGGNYREYLMGGILVQSLAFGMMGPATAIATDLTEGVVDRFRSLPASRLAYLLGHYAAELVGVGLAMAILLGTGLLVGWRPESTPVQTVEAVALLVVFSSTMIWLGTWLGMMVRSPDAVMGVGFVIIFPLTFISNAFVPIESMPSFLQWFASLNPVSVMVQAVRELFGNPTTPITKHTWPMDHAVAAAWLYCLVALVIIVPAAVRRYRTRTSD